MIEKTEQASPCSWENESLSQTRERLRRKWGDYPLTILIINPINLILVRKIAKTPITPNQLTLISFVITMAASGCFISTNHIIQITGGILLLLGYLIDCLDGDLARLKGLKSPLGAMLDPIMDRCGEMVIICGIALGGWRATSSTLWLVGGMLLLGVCQLYFYMTDAMLNIFKKETGLLNKISRKTLMGSPMRFGAIEPFIWGQAALACAGIPYWGVPVFGAMFAVFCSIQFYSLVKITRTNKTEQNDNFEFHVY
jgi:phosphatidylglycerophosphate synthase